MWWGWMIRSRFGLTATVQWTLWSSLYPILRCLHLACATEDPISTVWPRMRDAGVSDRVFVWHVVCL
jgi:hypothetical protein